MSKTVLLIWIIILVAVKVSPGHLDEFLPKADGDIYPWRTVQLTLASNALDGFSTQELSGFSFNNVPEV